MFQTLTKKSGRSYKEHDSRGIAFGNQINAEAKESREADDDDFANERRKSLRTRRIGVSNEAGFVKSQSAAKERRKSLRTPKKLLTA